MKIFFDLEMTGLHQSTTPISIGLVSEDGRVFYAEFCDFEPKQVNEWITENVMAHLRFANGYSWYPALDLEHFEMKGSRGEVGNALKQWFAQFESVEMWGDVLPYDWVLFCELFDAPIDTAERLPRNIYYIPFDIATLMKAKGVDPDISREEYTGIDGQKHNALHDAKIIKACYLKLSGSA